MKIGLVVAIETDSIFEYYKERTVLDCPKGYELYAVNKDGNEIYIVKTGMGIAAAAAGTQYLITRFGIDVIANFGVVGGLTHDMSSHKVCAVRNVVHYRYDCSEFMPLKIGQVAEHDSLLLPTDTALLEKALTVCPELMVVTCCSGDKFVAREEDKRSIHDTFGGDVCDMESAGIVLTCEANGVPCLMLKAVADGLSGGAREFYDELLDAASLCLGTADKIMSAISG